ncbi:MAG: triose-phosphate isomerase [Proteobacteria bacterium]|nr:triose-phosphate isomerase [Pseudomonadota bacterium]
MQRIPLLAGNWKMHKTVRDAVGLVEALCERLDVPGHASDREVLVCPPFTALSAVNAIVSRKGRIRLGCQNVWWAEKGAFTGEVSAEMAKDAGCRYVIVGHSERRALFGDTDALCQKKVRAVLDWGMSAILCVGESLEEREAGLTRSKVEGQVRAGLAGVSTAEGDHLVIAYEPIWAIGTGKSDTPQNANETCGHIRSVLGEVLGESVAAKIRIQYGGSVKPDNIDAYMAQPHIDGALVGGASLEAASFLRIVEFH